VFNILGALLQKKFNPKLIIAVGGAICLISVYTASIVQTWEMFLFFYAILFPMGIGIIYWTPIICAWEWFGDRKGLATGLIIGGFGFGAFIFGFVSTAIVNPNNLSREIDPASGNAFFPEEVAARVPPMFRRCVDIWAILLLVGGALISRNP
jgi:MFS family permease